MIRIVLQEEAVGNKVEGASGANDNFAMIQKERNELSKVKTLIIRNKDLAWEMFRNKTKECSCWLDMKN